MFAEPVSLDSVDTVTDLEPPVTVSDDALGESAPLSIEEGTEQGERRTVLKSPSRPIEGSRALQSAEQEVDDTTQY